MTDLLQTAKHQGDATDEKAKPAIFIWLERGVLAIITLMTLIAAGLEIIKVIELQAISLADILLMFLYLEVLSMIAVFYSGTGSPLVYPIFIAMTALARLIVLQGKDMAPQNILYEAISILILAIAALIILRTPRG
ncbi:MAG: phosphate-starvation-inducible PsiE family protein [Pseudomonadota bacterium]